MRIWPKMATTWVLLSVSITLATDSTSRAEAPPSPPSVPSADSSLDSLAPPPSVEVKKATRETQETADAESDGIFREFNLVYLKARQNQKSAIFDDPSERQPRPGTLLRIQSDGQGVGVIRVINSYAGDRITGMWVTKFEPPIELREGMSLKAIERIGELRRHHYSAKLGIGNTYFGTSISTGVTSEFYTNFIEVGGDYHYYLSQQWSIGVGADVQPLLLSCTDPVLRIRYLQSFAETIYTFGVDEYKFRANVHLGGTLYAPFFTEGNTSPGVMVAPRIYPEIIKPIGVNQWFGAYFRYSPFVNLSSHRTEWGTGFFYKTYQPKTNRTWSVFLDIALLRRTYSELSETDPPKTAINLAFMGIKLDWEK